MSSSINPNNIDGQYPVAGQDNDSQGFRDNFTNIRNNLSFAKTELEDLQSKVLLKSALAGTTLDNEMSNAQLKGVQCLRFTETLNDLGPLSGTVNVDWQDAHYQTLETAGTVTLDFTIATLSSTVSTGLEYVISLPVSLIQGSTAYSTSPTTTFAQFAGLNIKFDSKDITKPAISSVITYDSTTPTTSSTTSVALNTKLVLNLSISNIPHCFSVFVSFVLPIFLVSLIISTKGLFICSTNFLAL